MLEIAPVGAAPPAAVPSDPAVLAVIEYLQRSIALLDESGRHSHPAALIDHALAILRESLCEFPTTSPLSGQS